MTKEEHDTYAMVVTKIGGIIFLASSCMTYKIQREHYEGMIQIAYIMEYTDIELQLHSILGIIMPLSCLLLGIGFLFLRNQKLPGVFLILIGGIFSLLALAVTFVIVMVS